MLAVVKRLCLGTSLCVNCLGHTRRSLGGHQCAIILHLPALQGRGFTHPQANRSECIIINIEWAQQTTCTNHTKWVYNQREKVSTSSLTLHSKLQVTTTQKMTIALSRPPSTPRPHCHNLQRRKSESKQTHLSRVVRYGAHSLKRWRVTSGKQGRWISSKTRAYVPFLREYKLDHREKWILL